MPKFKIKFGLFNVEENEEIIEAGNLEQAEQIAFDAAMEAAQSWLFSEAEEISDEEAEEN